MLAPLRSTTLVVNVIVRLLVRAPAFGIAAIVMAAAGVVWAIAQPNTLLSTVLPALAAIAVAGIIALLAMATSPLEGRIHTWKQRLGLAVLLAVPVALVAFAFGLPFGLRHHLPWLDGQRVHLGAAASWLAGQATRTAVNVAGCAALAAAAAAIVRLPLGLASRGSRTVTLWIYRLALIAAAISIAIGATYVTISQKPHPWQATVPFLLLFGTISLAPFIAELAAGTHWLADQFTNPRRDRLSAFLLVGIWLLFFTLVFALGALAFLVGRHVG